MQAMPQLLPAALPDPHSAVSLLFWLIKQKKRIHSTLNTLHQTLHNTLTIHFTSLLLSLFPAAPPTTSVCSSATKSRVMPYHFVIGWCGAFWHQKEHVFFSCKHFLLANTFVTKARFLPFLTAPDTKQMWWQCSRSEADIFYRKSGFGRANASINSGGGAWGWASS